VNRENRLRVREAIDRVAQDLVLPPSPRHPRGRNPHAHIAKVIKSLLGISYTELPDEDTDEVVSLVEHIAEHPF
tara:strand:- start:566 stop:787 length:222 start_codon:yes stop_codon:yes gene_type:complete